MKSTRSYLATALIGLVSGCTVGPDYTPPKVNVEDSFGEQRAQSTTQPAEDVSSRTVNRSTSLVEWWTTFHDPQLDDLINRAVAANLDLKKATAKVREARAERGAIRADLFPEIDVDGQYEHVRPSVNGVASALGSGAPVNAGGTGTNAPGAGGSAAIPGASLGELDLYQAGFDASWEIDVFGKRRRAVESASDEIAAAVEDRRDVLLSLMAEVARNYIELRSTQQRLAIARDNLAAQQQTLKLTRELAERGITNQLDVVRAEAQVATTIAEIPTLETTASQAIHRLSILLDLQPTALSSELSAERPVPVVPDEIPIGIPSDLLKRRPDIRKAERQLAAATANIGSAKADWFPRFSLAGSLGLQSTDTNTFADYSSRFYSFGPSVSWPLFDGGRIRENVHVQEARQIQALLTYRQAILNACGNVDDSLVAYSKTQQRTVALRQAFQSNQAAVRIASDLYKRGLADFLAVLDAQRNLYASQDSLASSEGEVAVELVALYKSLGGGWELEPIVARHEGYQEK